MIQYIFLMLIDKKVLTSEKFTVILHLSININFFIKGDNIMKEEAISKMNKIGKIGSIIAKIMKIILIVALVVCIVVTIAVAILPENLVNLKVNGEAEIGIDVSEFDITFTDADTGETWTQTVKASDNGQVTITLEISKAKESKLIFYEAN